MPCCGGTGRPREWWPNPATQNFLSVVQHRDTLVDDGDQVRFVFLAALLEALLEGVLFPLLATKHGQGRAEEMMSRIQGAGQRPSVTRADQDIAEAIENAAVKAFAAVHNDVIGQCENAPRRLSRS